MTVRDEEQAMGTPAGARLTYREYEALPEPEDGSRWELVDGELVVTPPPGDPHQRALATLTTELTLWTRRQGGLVLPGAALLVAEDQELIPDLLLVLSANVDMHGTRAKNHADLVVEISSPSTRQRDLGRKRELYEAAAVAEYWFADLDRCEVLAHHLDDAGAYGEPTRLGRGETLTSPQPDGLALAARALFHE